MIETRKASRDDLVAWFGKPVTLEVIADAGETVGMVSIVEQNGRRMCNLNVKEGAHGRVIWGFRHWVQQQQRPLYTVVKWPGEKTAPRLCLAVGFEPTADKVGEHFVWVLP